MNTDMNNKSPFLGLEPYEESDAYRFKGRDTDTCELYKRLIYNEYVVCHAESGEGKSSLINAGLCPALKKNMYFPIKIEFTEDDYKDADINFDKIINERIINIVAKSQTELKFTQIPIRTNSQESSIFFANISKESTWWLLHTNRLHAGEEIIMPVLIFDQFEEVFNQPTSILWTEKFFSWLQQLSKDICPDEIIKIIRGHIGIDARFPDIPQQKQFKAIFSLRNEYMGQLDYWSMQQNFIPELKNNRYCLKPLTIEGAKKVIQLQEDFDPQTIDEIIWSIVKSNDIKERSLDDFSIKNFPCIPALMLSIICDSIYNNKKEEIAKLKERKNIENLIIDILSDFYDKVMTECVPDKKDRELIEDVLVDEKGNRTRIQSNSKELREIDFIFKYEEKLKNKRLIRITKINGGDYIELIHDSLLQIVIKHKENLRKELEELKSKAEKNRESTLILSTLSILLFYTIYALYTVLYNDIIISFSTKNFSAVGITNILLAANLFTLPLTDIAVIKKNRIAKYLSIYTLVTNCTLCIGYILNLNIEFKSFNSFFEILSPPKMFFLCILMSISLIYVVISFYEKNALKKASNQIVNMWNTIFLRIYYLLLSCFIFYTTIFCPLEKMSSEYKDSFWGIIVIPFLFFTLFKKKPYWHYILYLLILGIFAINGSNIITLPLWSLYVVLLLLTSFLFYSFNQTHCSRYYKIGIPVLNLIIVIIVLIFQLGYNPFRLNYSSAVREVHKMTNLWTAIAVKSNNNFGLFEAVTGDTLLPCIFDSIIPFVYNNGSHSNGAFSFQIHAADTIFIGYIALESELNRKTVKVFTNPKFENALYRLSKKSELKDLNDSIKSLTAKTFIELRNAVLIGLKTNSFNISNYAGNLDLLNNLYTAKTQKTLTEITNNVKTHSLTDNLVTEFRRAITQELILCIAKDRIVHNEILDLAQVLTYFLFLEFPEESFANNMKFTSSGRDEKYLIYETSNKDLANNMSYSWASAFKITCFLDIVYNSPAYLKNMKYEILLLKEINNKLQNQNINKSLLSKSIQVLGKLSNLEVKSSEYINQLGNVIQEFKNCKDELKSKLNNELQILETYQALEYIESDYNFYKLVHSTLDSFLPIIEDSNYIDYNSVLADICKELIIVGYFRRYGDMNSNFDRLKTAENKRLGNIYGQVSEFLGNYSKYSDSLAHYAKIYRSQIKNLQ